MTSNLMKFTFGWGGRQQTSQIRGVLDIEKVKNKAGQEGWGAGNRCWALCEGGGWLERRQREGGVQVKAEGRRGLGSDSSRRRGLGSRHKCS